MFIIARALASVYNEGLYAEMYSINLAAVSTCDYAFELNNLIYTHFMWIWKIGGRFEVIQLETHWHILKAFDCDCAEIPLFLHWDDKKHLSLDIINHCIYVFHWRRSSDVLEKSVHMLI